MDVGGNTYTCRPKSVSDGEELIMAYAPPGSEKEVKINQFMNINPPYIYIHICTCKEIMFLMGI